MSEEKKEKEILPLLNNEMIMLQDLVRCSQAYENALVQYKKYKAQLTKIKFQREMIKAGKIRNFIIKMNDSVSYRENNIETVLKYYDTEIEGLEASLLTIENLMKTRRNEMLEAMSKVVNILKIRLPDDLIAGVRESQMTKNDLEKEKKALEEEFDELVK